METKIERLEDEVPNFFILAQLLFGYAMGQRDAWTVETRRLREYLESFGKNAEEQKQ